MFKDSMGADGGSNPMFNGKERRENSIESMVFRRAVEIYTDGKSDPILLEEIRLLAIDPKLKQEIKDLLESDKEDSEIEMNAGFVLRAKKESCASAIAEKMSKLINANIIQRVSRKVFSDVTGGDPALAERAMAILKSEEFKKELREMWQRKGGVKGSNEFNLQEQSALLEDIMSMILRGSLSE